MLCHPIDVNLLRIVFNATREKYRTEAKTIITSRIREALSDLKDFIDKVMFSQSLNFRGSELVGQYNTFECQRVLTTNI